MYLCKGKKQIRQTDEIKLASTPIIADVFTLLDYMEKRGSGLRKMRELTEKLPNYLPAKEPQYQTQGSAFYTTFYNLNWGGNGQIPVEEIVARITSSEEKFGNKQKGSVKNAHLGHTAQTIIDLVIADGTISQERMAEKIGISKRAIEKQIANLKAKHILIREGADKGGYWRVIVSSE